VTRVRLAFAVRGRVQGVGFRWFVEQRAAAGALAGFVRNEADGRVTGEVEGSEQAVAEFVTALRRGPALARVDEVIETPLHPTGEAEFRIQR
jgi:acylphosphatase